MTDTRTYVLKMTLLPLLLLPICNKHNFLVSSVLICGNGGGGESKTLKIYALGRGKSLLIWLECSSSVVVLLLLLSETQAVGECPKILANDSHTWGGASYNCKRVDTERDLWRCGMKDWQFAIRNALLLDMLHGMIFNCMIQLVLYHTIITGRLIECPLLI